MRRTYRSSTRPTDPHAPLIHKDREVQLQTGAYNEISEPLDQALDRH